MKFKSLIISIFLLTFLLFPSSLVLARAGGGHGGTGGHSSSSSSSGSVSHSSSSYNRNGSIGTLSSIVGTILFISVFLLSGLRSKDFSINTCLLLNEQSKKARKLIIRLSQIDNSYNYNPLIKRVSDCFYIVQKAWMERNQIIAKNYMNKNIYELHEIKTNWMKIRNEKNILKRIKILNIKPVCVNSYKNKSSDNLWFYIKATMADYTIDDRTSKVTGGSVFNKIFIEYWKFVRSDNRWVLAEIRQTNEVDINILFNSNSELL
ncbi:Tim44 domain-containing protein [Clostridium arbusti]|uniref:Tim44 domain-containing protein n=1 Tax=Clostridium arbusti TaxID=1137848 RepID=UPI0002880F38|nr:Tim44-like domain-containing protein [Clostridium arbusti]